MGSSIKKPESVRKVIDGLLKRLGLSDGVKQQQALMFWPEVVGETLAKVSAPIRIEHGRMYVEVEHNSWRQEIHFYEREIIERLNKKLDKKVVKEIIFV